MSNSYRHPKGGCPPELIGFSPSSLTMTSPDPQPTEADIAAANPTTALEVTQADRDLYSALGLATGAIYRREFLQKIARHAQQAREEERERNAKVADAAAEEATRIALTHPEDSDSRSRMWARAREAQYIAADIRNLSLKDQADG